MVSSVSCDNVLVLVVQREDDMYEEEASEAFSRLGVSSVFGNTLEQFTAQLPQLPDDKKCMVLWAAGDSQLVASVLQHYGTDKLSWVHSLSAGVDNLVPALVSNHLADKVCLTNARGAFSKSLAEYSLMCMLHFNKKVPLLQRLQKDRTWRKIQMPVVRGKTVGFVGFGSIAQETAKVCRPLGMKILALRNRPDGPGSDLADEVLNAGVPEEKNKLFRESDFLVCSLPGTKNTQHFCGSHEFSLMRPSSVFISIGRGVCVDESSLYTALSTPHRGPAAAAMDVFESEPLKEDSKLWSLGPDKLLISSHCADFTEDYVTLTVDLFMKLVVEFSARKSPEDLPNQVRIAVLSDYACSSHSMSSKEDEVIHNEGEGMTPSVISSRSWTMIDNGAKSKHENDDDYTTLPLASSSSSRRSISNVDSIHEERQRRLALMLRERVLDSSNSEYDDWTATVRDLLQPDNSSHVVDCETAEDGRRTTSITGQSCHGEGSSIAGGNLSDLVTDESVSISSSSAAAASSSEKASSTDGGHTRSSLDDLVCTVLRDMGCAASSTGTISAAASVADINDVGGLPQSTSGVESLSALCRRHPIATALMGCVLVYHFGGIATGALKRRRMRMGPILMPNRRTCAKISFWMMKHIVDLISIGGSRRTPPPLPEFIRSIDIILH
ncbi:hypothetical protein FOL46_003161 [Perkinsus olseni]|uniref:D-isomer specific 2-hydroxyacid dehydrogenase NAD-binding domain-containing protein n=1 Tax=Perkinsus olseni TaxID=32597 RepID=A0A7J6MTU8_PEROL|nr:hypothetical protein FOL46_003161 [Perkinsus olseni]